MKTWNDHSCKCKTAVNLVHVLLIYSRNRLPVCIEELCLCTWIELGGKLLSLTSWMEMPDHIIIFMCIALWSMQTGVTISIGQYSVSYILHTVLYKLTTILDMIFTNCTQTINVAHLKKGQGRARCHLLRRMYFGLNYTAIVTNDIVVCICE